VTKHVVIIDDDPDLLGLLTDGLALYGTYTISACTDGESGLATVINQRPDCIVADVMMPGLTGYQFVAALRGDPDTEHIPLIILSALVQERDKMVGLLRGADAYLTKPVEFTHLVAAIEKSISVTSQQRTTRQQQLASSTEMNIDNID